MKKYCKCKLSAALALAFIIMAVLGTVSFAHAGGVITEKNVPRKTKSAKEAMVRIGDKILYSYGQWEQDGNFRKKSGCGYCAVASLCGLVKNKKVLPMTICKANRSTGLGNYKNIAKALKKQGVRFQYFRSFGGRKASLLQIRKCLQEHRPVIVTVTGRWSTGARHYLLLVGITDKGNVLVCDSARDRRWSGSMQRFKIVRWSGIAPYISKLSKSKKTDICTNISQIDAGGKKVSGINRMGFIAAAAPAY